MDAERKAALIREVGGLRYGRTRRPEVSGIPCSTFYAWKRKYEREGIMELEKRAGKGRTWNRLTEYERERGLGVVR